jgi:hypothetical protein
MLTGESRIFKHHSANSLYVLIPAKIASDSAFTIKKGDHVLLTWDPQDQVLIIEKKNEAIT